MRRGTLTIKNMTKAETHAVETVREFFRKILEREPRPTGYELGAPFRDVPELMRISRSLHRCDENACNGFADYAGNWDKAASVRNDKRTERLEKKAQAIADKYNAIAYHQSDPRGASLYIVPKLGHANHIENRYYSDGVAMY